MILKPSFGLLQQNLEVCQILIWRCRFLIEYVIDCKRDVLNVKAFSFSCVEIGIFSLQGE